MDRGMQTGVPARVVGIDRAGGRRRARCVVGDRRLRQGQMRHPGASSVVG